jgi:hypothetical protein
VAAQILKMYPYNQQPAGQQSRYPYLERLMQNRQQRDPQQYAGMMYQQPYQQYYPQPYQQPYQSSYQPSYQQQYSQLSVNSYQKPTPFDVMYQYIVHDDPTKFFEFMLGSPAPNYNNPKKLKNNCLFVTLGRLLGISSLQVSRFLEVDEADDRETSTSRKYLLCS